MSIRPETATRSSQRKPQPQASSETGSPIIVAVSTFPYMPTRRSVSRCLSIAAEIAQILVQLREKPRFLDWLSLGLSAADVGLRIHEELTTPPVGDPYQYFRGTEWAYVSSIFTSYIAARLTDPTPVVMDSDAEVFAWEGKMGSARIGWTGNRNANPLAYIVRLEDKAALYESIREVIWERIGSPNAVVTVGKVGPDILFNPNFLETEFYRDLLARMQAFQEPRSYLIFGLPGTGKSETLIHALRAQNLRTLRVPVGEFVSSPYTSHEEDGGQIEETAEILQTQAVILDDLDRVPLKQQGGLLYTLERLRKTARIVIATANDPTKLDPALRRPERFDDIFCVPHLDLSTIQHLLGEQADLAPRMTHWPIAFIIEFKKRVAALGLEQAMSEIESIEDRVAENYGLDDEDDS